MSASLDKMRCTDIRMINLHSKYIATEFDNLVLRHYRKLSMIRSQ